MYNNVKYVHGGKFISRNIWKHPERTNKTDQIIIVLEGKVYITVENEHFTLSQGDTLFIPKGKKHYGTEYSPAQVSFYWLHFSGADIYDTPIAYLHTENYYQLKLLSQQLLHYANIENYPAECTDYLIRMLLMELDTQTLKTDKKLNKICYAIKEWVKMNADIPIKVSDVAKHFNYNEDYINRIFKVYYPDGLKAFINNEKMQKIKTDLLSNISLSEITEKYAFSDYKYFLKFFKYHEGVSPTKYRQTYCNIHTNNK